MAQRGGKRPGAGRPQGRRNKATVEQKLTLEELARTHTETALAVLVDIARYGQSEAARVSAANAILDRGYGKPRQLEPASASGDDEVRSVETTAKMKAAMEDLNALLDATLPPAAAQNREPTEIGACSDDVDRVASLPWWAASKAGEH